MKTNFTFLILILIGSQLNFAQFVKPSKTNTSDNTINVKEIRTGGYSFINPLLDYYETNPSSIASNKILQKNINDYVTKKIANKEILSASVYYRDLNLGPWIGINENVEYSPASLLKVPFLIAALKEAQLNPDFLQKEEVYIPNENQVARNVTDSFGLIPGNLYTMSDLLSEMIIHSDNDAKDLLVKNIPYAIYNQIFNDLNIDIQKYDTLTNQLNFLSVKQYASFFRILYNSTFLNKQMSEYALWLLSNTTYNDGIKAGIPDTVKVSHKFGERFYVNTDVKQLHDCGIIYKAGTPYLLCVMTKGSDLKKMSQVIAGISKIVYTHLDQSATHVK
jgi:beta-lactamase class A